jgi:16S rRNA (cytosine967-C5)-methyltransferase
MIMQNPSPRQIAVEILNRVEDHGAFAEPFLDAMLSRDGPAHIQDRRLLTHIVYGTLRMRGRLDYMIGQLYRGDFARMETGIKNILRTAIHQLLFTDRIPEFAIVNEAVEISKKTHPAASGLVNALLRNAIRRKNEFRYPEISKEPARHISALYSHPLWMVERWIGVFGIDETVAICRANNDIPPYALRVNRMKTTREQVVKELTHDGFEVKLTGFSPDGVIIINSPISLRETTLYQSGHVRIQDEASQLIAYVVDPKPGDGILDVCTGTGGKATHLAEILGNQGHIVAIDINQRKVESLRETATRQGFSIIDAQWADATADLGEAFREAFDRVLIDAPCSGLGTLRRNPELKWRTSEKTPKEFNALQKKILKRCAEYVRKGGVIIYSTCTVTPEETDEIIDDFINHHHEFRQIRPSKMIHSAMIDGRKHFRTHTHRHDMDGFFAVSLIKETM